MQLTMNNDSLGCIKKFQQNEISTRPRSLPFTPTGFSCTGLFVFVFFKKWFWRFTIASMGEKCNKNFHISKFGSQCLAKNIKKLIFHI